VGVKDNVGGRMRRWRLVILLAILATGLAFSLVEYGRSTVTTHAGYREVWTRTDKPLLYSAEFADLMSAPDDPDPVMAVATFKGFFARPGAPRLVALLGGIVLPVLLVLAAIGVAVRRRWVHMLALWIAALFMFGMVVDVPGKYFHGVSTADVREQIATRGIYVTKIDAGMDCLGTKPCFATPYYAFTTGVFAADGVPRLLAIALGMVLPGLLIIGSVVVAFRPKPRKTPS